MNKPLFTFQFLSFSEEDTKMSVPYITVSAKLEGTEKLKLLYEFQIRIWNNIDFIGRISYRV